MKIEVGQIWEVVKDFTTSGLNDRNNRPVLLRKGEKIEIRYPYEWHFRTEDRYYTHANPDVILANCVLFGIIDEKTRWQNIAQLDEILRLKLYTEQK
jgi:hypothetical protein